MGLATSKLCESVCGYQSSQQHHQQQQSEGTRTTTKSRRVSTSPSPSSPKRTHSGNKGASNTPTPQKLNLNQVANHQYAYDTRSVNQGKDAIPRSSTTAAAAAATTTSGTAITDTTQATQFSVAHTQEAVPPKARRSARPSRRPSQAPAQPPVPQPDSHQNDQFTPDDDKNVTITNKSVAAKDAAYGDTEPFNENYSHAGAELDENFTLLIEKTFSELMAEQSCDAGQESDAESDYRASEHIFRNLQRVSDVSNRNSQVSSFNNNGGGGGDQHASRQHHPAAHAFFAVDTFKGCAISRFAEKLGLVESVFRVSSRTLAVRTMRYLTFYNVQTGRVNSRYDVFELNRQHSPQMHLLPSKKQAVSGGERDNNLAVWDILNNGRGITLNRLIKVAQNVFKIDQIVPMHGNAVAVVDAHNAQLLVVNLDRSTIVKRMAYARYFDAHSAVTAHFFNHARKKLALADATKCVLFSLPSFRVIKTVHYPRGADVKALLLMRDSNILVLGALFDIFLVSVTTQAVLNTRRQSTFAHSSYVTCLKQLDRDVFASGSSDKTVKIWLIMGYGDSCTLSLLRCLSAHNSRIDSIFVMDRSTLLTIDRYEPENPAPNVIVWK